MEQKLKVLEYSEEHWREVEAIIKEATSKWGKAWEKHALKLYNPKGKLGIDVFRYVALVCGGIVATITLKTEVDSCVIYFLAVKKELRGRGIGSTLINFAEEFAKKKGLSIIRVDTAEEFPENVNFYKEHGFKMGGKVKNVYMMGDSQIFFWKKTG